MPHLITTALIPLLLVIETLLSKVLGNRTAKIWLIPAGFILIPLVQGRDMYAPPDSELRLSVPLVYFFDHDVIWLPLRNDLAQIAGIVRRSLDIYQRPIYLVYVGARPLSGRLLPPGAKLITNQLNRFSETENAYHIPKRQRELKIGLHVYKL